MTTITVEQIENWIKTQGEQETPFLIMDQGSLRNKCRSFLKAYPRAKVHFSVKACHNIGVLKLFAEEGLGFDVASWEEISLLLNLGVSPEMIIFSAPTKRPKDIERAFKAGISLFAYDSTMEIDKLAKLAPGTRLEARLIVDNTGSEWPLERKFGMSIEDAVETWVYARSLGLDPCGATFHVGSQNHLVESWVRALDRVRMFSDLLKLRGESLKIINLGGGYPVEYQQAVPSIEEFGMHMTSEIDENFGKDMEILLEPGRGLVGDSGVMVTSVINRSVRAGENWLYVDLGAFTGLIESLEQFGFRYKILTSSKNSKLIPYIIAGPTCDSEDILQDGVLLPEDLTLNDKLYFLTAGAYTTSLENYNGFSFPSTVLV